MTHDELLVNLTPTQERGFPSNPISVLTALRAVVELHKPSEDDPSQCWACSAYANHEYEADYPCWTIQAIEKELAHSTDHHFHHANKASSEAGKPLEECCNCGKVVEDVWSEDNGSCKPAHSTES